MPSCSKRVVAPALILTLALLLLGCSQPDEVRVMTARVSGDGRFLILNIAACHAEPTVEVAESRQEVRVEVHGTNQSNGDDCSDGVRVELRRPLAQRKLVDETTGDPVKVVR